MLLCNSSIWQLDIHPPFNISDKTLLSCLSYFEYIENFKGEISTNRTPACKAFLLGFVEQKICSKPSHFCFDNF